MATLTSPLQALLQGRGPRGGRDGGIGPGKPVRAHRECCTMTEPSTEDEEEAETRLLEDEDLFSLGCGSGVGPEEDGTYGGAVSSEESEDEEDSDADGPLGDADGEGEAGSWVSQQQRLRGAASIGRRLQQQRRRQKTYQRPRQRCGNPATVFQMQPGEGSSPLAPMTLGQLEQLESAQASYRAANSAAVAAARRQEPFVGGGGGGGGGMYAASLVTAPLSTPFWALQPCHSYPPSQHQHQHQQFQHQHQQFQHQQQQPSVTVYQPYQFQHQQQQYHHHQHHQQQQHAPFSSGPAYHPLKQQQQQLQGGPLVRQSAYTGREEAQAQAQEDDDPVTFQELLGWDEAPPRGSLQAHAHAQAQTQAQQQFDSIGGGSSGGGGFPFPIAAEEEAGLLPPPAASALGGGRQRQEQLLAADPEELRTAEEAAVGAARREEARQRAAAAVTAMAGQGQAPQAATAAAYAWQTQQGGKPPRPESAVAPGDVTAAVPVPAPAPVAEQLPQAQGPLGLEAWEVGPRYRMVRLLGHGSYGEVAEAWDTAVKRRVAVKRIRNAFENVTDARRIYREMYILRQLRSHPNMVTLLDVVAPEDFSSFIDLYLVFEYVDTDLYKLILSPQQLSNDHIETFVYQLLLSLKYLQSAHVIHRDLKPANILLNEDCSLKLCDFGLARVVNQQCIRGQQGSQRGGLHDPNDTYPMDALSPITEGRATSPPPPPSMAPGGMDMDTGMGLGLGLGLGNPPPPAPRLVRRQMSEMALREEQQQAVVAATAALGPPPRLTRQLTKHVVTRWYRAPELILLQDYTQAVDVWSLGCIFAELLSMQTESVPNHRERAPLFPGKSCFPLSVDQARPSCADKLDQLNVIFDIIGTPSGEDLEGLGSIKRYFQALAPRSPRPLSEFYPGAHPEALDLLSRMLRFNPDRRITVDEALAHPYLQHVRDRRLEVSLVAPLVDRGTSGLSLERVKRALYQEVCAFHAPVLAPAAIPLPEPVELELPAILQEPQQHQPQQPQHAGAAAEWLAAQQQQRHQQQWAQQHGQARHHEGGAVAMME